MLALAQWLSKTPASSAIREFDWLIPLLQTIHILAIAAVMSSALMIGLRIMQVTQSRESIADTWRRFESWIWAGLVFLAASGAPLIIAEPPRTLPNLSFQIKIVLLLLAAFATWSLRAYLRGNAEFSRVSGKASPAVKALAVGAFVLWCAVAAAGRFIAYTQPI